MKEQLAWSCDRCLRPGARAGAGRAWLERRAAATGTPCAQPRCQDAQGGFLLLLAPLPRVWPVGRVEQAVHAGAGARSRPRWALLLREKGFGSCREMGPDPSAVPGLKLLHAELGDGQGAPRRHSYVSAPAEVTSAASAILHRLAAQSWEPLLCRGIQLSH